MGIEYAEIFCGHDNDDKVCNAGPLGMRGQGPAYAYGDHWKCQKHRDAYERAQSLSTRLREDRMKG